MNTRVQVDPGDLEDFSTYVRQLADAWKDPNGPAYKLATASAERPSGGGEDLYPRLGLFTEAAEFGKAYEGRLGQVGPAFDHLYKLLDGLAIASKKLADDYRSTAELNRAKVEEVAEILGKEMGRASTPAAGTPEARR